MHPIGDMKIVLGPCLGVIGSVTGFVVLTSVQKYEFVVCRAILYKCASRETLVYYYIIDNISVDAINVEGISLIIVSTITISLYCIYYTHT